MSYIPIVLKGNDKNIVFVGQGRAILEKIEKFKSFSKHLIFLCTDNQQSNVENCEMIYMNPSQWNTYVEDLKPRFVVQAGLDEIKSKELYQYCIEHYIEINTVDEPSLCTFIMPVVFEQGKLNISISTSGASPMMARLLMNQFTNQLPDDIDEILDWFYMLRRPIKPQLNITFKEWRVLQQNL